jgi:hypothetical protein
VVVRFLKERQNALSVVGSGKSRRLLGGGIRKQIRSRQSAALSGVQFAYEWFLFTLRLSARRENGHAYSR